MTVPKYYIFYFIKKLAPTEEDLKILKDHVSLNIVDSEISKALLVEVVDLEMVQLNQISPDWKICEVNWYNKLNN